VAQPLSTPRSCAFCNWNGDVGAEAHATIVHPDKDWAVVPQFGHEFVIDMGLVRAASAELRAARSVPDNAALREAAEWHLANPHNVNEGHSRLRAALPAAPASPAVPVTRLSFGPDDIDAALRTIRGSVTYEESIVMAAASAAADVMRGGKIERLASPEEASPEPYTAGKGMSEYDRLSHKGAVDERDF